MSARILRPALVALALVAGLDSAGAGEYGRVQSYGSVYAPSYPYGASYGYGGYGFADEAVRGAYIGAPLTKFPRPSEIVPPAWSYGTYGVPTISGIARAPVGEPTLTVIHAQPSATRQPARSRVLAREEGGRWSRTDGTTEVAPSSGARIIEVRVPRR